MICSRCEAAPASARVTSSSAAAPACTRLRARSSWARPIGNIWTDRALPWVTIDWSQPHFPGQPADRQPLFDAYAAAIAKG